MTRTQLGPNGEQQRVTVERDFKNENDLNKFLKGSSFLSLFYKWWFDLTVYDYFVLLKILSTI